MIIIRRRLLTFMRSWGEVNHEGHEVNHEGHKGDVGRVEAYI